MDQTKRIYTITLQWTWFDQASKYIGIPVQNEVDTIPWLHYIVRYFEYCGC